MQPGQICKLKIPTNYKNVKRRIDMNFFDMFNKKKNQRIISGVIIAVVVLAMVVTTVFSVMP